MAKLVTVHKAIPAEVSKVVSCLENRCLHPVVLDNEEKMGPYRSQTHEIRIAVPETERDLAIRVLAQRERQDRLRLFPVIKRTNAVVLLLVVVLSILAIVGLLDASGLWFTGLWIVLTIAVALVLLRLAWRKKPKA